ncbi:Piso0_004543 [Millerozyma farinosa CBS 7064]|uniref:Piso0_004543 protein n=1 Tax=Pichia sorbitophila (strain ATCC MYA-4447 / BCRC 22081 / CBS 7064 / NBRC 10061 / NRRL Y-12695) TaxID=559304 RepID=G8Y932_PICSO|nr:Piso0_004543 [Millerozyma farinosa CBS 7064]CCE84977.1 Piso0_004543 [Millerozyma farinosa CBS 7064]
MATRFTWLKFLECPVKSKSCRVVSSASCNLTVSSRNSKKICTHELFKLKHVPLPSLLYTSYHMVLPFNDQAEQHSVSCSTTKKDSCDSSVVQEYAI